MPGMQPHNDSYGRITFRLTRHKKTAKTGAMNHKKPKRINGIPLRTFQRWKAEGLPKSLHRILKNMKKFDAAIQAEKSKRRGKK